MKKPIFLFLLLGAIIMATFPGLSTAAAVNGSITNSANVAAFCNFSVFSNLNFGKYNPLTTHKTAPLDNSSQLNITCTKGTVFSISSNFGLYPAIACNTSSQLRMRDSGTGAYINYSIYVDAARTGPWPGYSASCGGTQYTFSSTDSLNPYYIFLYGRVPGGQTTVAAGNYSDTVTFTITY